MRRRRGCERDHATLGGDAVDDARVPVVQDGGQVVQEDHRHASGSTELSIDEVDAIDRHSPGRCVLVRRRGD